MKSESKRNWLSGLRRSDKIILGVITVMVIASVILNMMQRGGLTLINESITLYLPVLALFVLLCWGVYALVRRIRNRIAKIAVSIIAVLLLFVLLLMGYAYLSIFAFSALPHHFNTLSDPTGAHQLVVMWKFDTDEARTESSIEARKAARLEAYPDSDPEQIADDLTVTFTAYPRERRLFYRSNADVEGTIYLAYTGNVVMMDTIAPAEGEAGDGAQPQQIETPHGTLMLEWLDDNTTAHLYVKDPGVAEGGECAVHFDR